MFRVGQKGVKIRNYTCTYKAFVMKLRNREIQIDSAFALEQYMLCREPQRLLHFPIFPFRSMVQLASRKLRMTHIYSTSFAVGPIRLLDPKQV